MANQITLVLIKPDALKRRIENEIISMIYALDGAKIIDRQILEADKIKIQKHYEVHCEKYFFKWLVDELSSGPIIALAIEGKEIIEKIRNLAGPTDPAKAPLYTIRGRFFADSCEKANEEKRAVRNCVHSSDSIISANRELDIWFPTLDKRNQNSEIKEFSLIK